MINAPVLLIIFNRPDTTKKVFDAIRKAKPKKLYVSGDGPRLENENDQVKCDNARAITKNIDWDCEVKYRFLDENLGCGWGPASAISWAFENEDYLIIIEDDCVPSLAFFTYCDELLKKYTNDNRVWLISGNQYNEEAVTTKHSYFFSRFGHSWGWATWKRCWNEMDMEMKKLPLIIEQDLFKSAFRTKKQASFFLKKYSEIFENKKMIEHIWDFQFGFAIIANGGLSIVPTKNLVTNIGYVGTHNVSRSHYHDRPVDENYRVNSHPDFVLCDVDYDAYHFKKHWRRKPLLFRIVIKFINLFKDIIR